MPETHEDLERQLKAHEEETARNEAAILETRKLLEKVDKKRREIPSERAKWNAKLDELETILSEKKRLLTASETHCRQIRKKIETGQYADGEATAPPAPEPEVSDETLPQNITIDDLQKAVRRVLGTHLVQLQTVSDLDYRMARAFLGSKAAARLNPDHAAELRKRIKMLDKTRGSVQKNISRHEEAVPEQAPAPAPSERQALLKSVLAKCAANEQPKVTLEELVLLSKYAVALSQSNPDTDELPRINEALDTLRGFLREPGLN